MESLIPLKLSKIPIIIQKHRNALGIYLKNLEGMVFRAVSTVVKAGPRVMRVVGSNTPAAELKNEKKNLFLLPEHTV